MAEDFGTALPPLPEQPQKKNNNLLIIIVVVLIVLCCCCLIVGGSLVFLWNYGDQLVGAQWLHLLT
jgi:hypothetical protein